MFKISWWLRWAVVPNQLGSLGSALLKSSYCLRSASVSDYCNNFNIIQETKSYFFRLKTWMKDLSWNLNMNIENLKIEIPGRNIKILSVSKNIRIKRLLIVSLNIKLKFLFIWMSNHNSQTPWPICLKFWLNNGNLL